MKTIKGDLIKLAKEGHFDVILHGCNCFCAMGAGIAKQIKQHFPAAYKADLATSKGDKKKLGTITFAQCGDVAVVNCYTQYNYGGGKDLFEYEKFEQCLLEVKHLFSGKRIAYPLIGAGLAKGDWNRISETINNVFEGEDHTLVIYQ